MKLTIKIFFLEIHMDKKLVKNMNVLKLSFLKIYISIKNLFFLIKILHLD